MAKWQRLCGGKDTGNIDYQDMCDMFSRMTGAGIRYERKGDIVTLYTDGDPQEVLETLIIMGIIDSILETTERELKFERNARLN